MKKTKRPNPHIGRIARALGGRLSVEFEGVRTRAA